MQWYFLHAETTFKKMEERQGVSTKHRGLFTAQTPITSNDQGVNNKTRLQQQ